jgi:hypothetical protein
MDILTRGYQARRPGKSVPIIDSPPNEEMARVSRRVVFGCCCIIADDDYMYTASIDRRRPRREK